ncbi:AMP-binding protein [Tistrella mobilis]|uniref:AMP-binding protein n=1 Tax=Tistrella mobilis TaxID=171437 RepID=UPI003556DE64
MSELTMSYVCGTSDEPLRYETIGTALARTAETWPEGDALVVVHQNIRWSWAEFDRRVTELAAGMIGLGLEPGDRIGIWAPNRVEWLLTLFAAMRAGLILVNINPAYRTFELEHALNLSGCRALVLAETFKTSRYVDMLLEIAPEFAAAGGRAERLPALDFVIPLGESRGAMIGFDRIALYADDASRAKLQAIIPTLRPDDPVNIQFTSGTTGSPKGATLTHNNILNNGFFVGRLMGFTEADRLCIPVPLYHCFGMVLSVLACVTHGATMVFPSEAFEPRAALQAVQAERCTALHGVPTMFITELALPDFKSFDLSTLRTGIMAGAPCPIDTMREVIAKMNMREVTICYGMTETSPVSFQTRADVDLETRTETVGTIHPFVEVRIVDGDDRVVPVNTVGELHTRGYNVMAGYWNDEARTRDAIAPGGWMRTGDLGVIDERGRCRIVGRSKDMILRGGENIYPVEIENFLITHPGILDVAVFGIADAKYGEQVCAWIRRADSSEGRSLTEAAVLGFCEGRIAHFKIPRRIRFVEEMPMTVTGKIQKFLMRQAEEEGAAI